MRRVLRVAPLVGLAAVLLTTALAYGSKPKPTEFAILVKVVGPNAAGTVVPIYDAEVLAGSNAWTNRNGLTAVKAGPNIQAGDYLWLEVKADGYRTAHLHYLVTDQRATRALPGPSTLRSLINFLVGADESPITFVLERGSDTAEAEVDLSIRVVDTDGDPVPNATVKLCCSNDAPLSSVSTNGKGETFWLVKRSTIEGGLQARVTTKDGRGKFSNISTSVLNGSGERVFLVILPKRCVRPGATSASSASISISAASAAPVEASMAFDKTDRYRIKVSGTASAWCPTTATMASDCSFGSPLALGVGQDALYCYAAWHANCKPPSPAGMLHLNGVDFATFAGKTFAYSASHTYSAEVSGLSGKLTLTIADSVGDDSGEFHVATTDLGPVGC